MTVPTPWGGYEGSMSPCATGLWAELGRGNLNTMYCGTLLWCCSLLMSPQAWQRRWREESQVWKDPKLEELGGDPLPVSWRLHCALSPPRLPSTRASPVVAPLCSFSRICTQKQRCGELCQTVRTEKRKEGQVRFPGALLSAVGIRSHASRLFFNICCFSSIPSTSQSPGKVCSDMNAQGLGGAVHAKGLWSQLHSSTEHLLLAQSPRAQNSVWDIDQKTNKIMGCDEYYMWGVCDLWGHWWASLGLGHQKRPRQEVICSWHLTPRTNF